MAGVGGQHRKVEKHLLDGVGPACAHHAVAWGSHARTRQPRGAPVPPFRKVGMAMTVDGSGDDRITLEGLDKPYTFAGDGNSSDDEGSSETGNDGGGGGDDKTVDGEGDQSGEGLEDGDSSDEDTRRGKSDAHQGVSLHCLGFVAVALTVAVKSTDIPGMYA